MSAQLPPCPFEVLIVAKTRLGPAGACIGGDYLYDKLARRALYYLNRT